MTGRKAIREMVICVENWFCTLKFILLDLYLWLA
jgi:hypothetical protein